VRLSTSETREHDRVVRVVRIDDKQVSFSISGDVLPPTRTLSDAAVVCAIFWAMRHGRPLEVDGPVSTTLLRNLEEFQEAWATWRPDVYSPVAIRAEEEREPAPSPDRRGAFAYSGGIDSGFALLRHMHGLAGRRSVQPAVAVLIHGFDIPLRDRSAFAVGERSARQSLDALGVPLSVVETDWRDVLCQDWEMEFVAGIAACLHQFTGVAGTAVLGADEDYAHIALPWGSNPVTNPLLSGGDLTLHTEGGGFGRTERIALVSESPDVVAGLRVCWEGPMTGRNCGDCEKCLRTRLGFLACGKEATCFDGPLRLRSLLRMKARNRVQIGYLEEILQAARRNGIRARWCTALRAVLMRSKSRLRLRALTGRSYT
jgi:hypothetical protein